MIQKEECEEIKNEIFKQVDQIMEQAQHLERAKSALVKIKKDEKLTEEQKQTWIALYEQNIEDREEIIVGKKGLIKQSLVNLQRCMVKKNE